jgi:hypothetical protein
MSTYPRKSVLFLSIASAAVIVMAVMAVDPAAAEFKQIGHVSKNGLRATCGAEGGHFEAAKSGEYWCEKGGNLVDCNSKGNCIGGTPRLSGSDGVGTGGFTRAQSLAKASASFLSPFERKGNAGRRANAGKRYGRR